MSKPKVIKDYDRLPDNIIEEVKLKYPYGFEKHLIQFKNPKGKLVMALPYEAENYYYLIRMTREEAQEIIEDDDDYDTEGNLKEEAQEIIEEVDGLENLMDESTDTD